MSPLTHERSGNGLRKQVGIWIRVSTQDQAKGESPEHHEARARQYAQFKGWDVQTIYHLEGVSGKAIFDHPETQRMLKDVESGAITALIFSKLARLARNTGELLQFSEIFREHNADLVSLQESIDTSSPAGRLLYTMISALAQWEREEISERVAASVPIRAKLGKSTGGSASFGYQWKDRKLVPHPDEAPIRKRMYELFLEHKRRRTVARLLNEAGYRTRSGGQFSDTTVERLLSDPIAKGLRRANYTKSAGIKKPWGLKPEKDWVFSEVEPVVSSELWDQCNHILAAQRKTGKPMPKKGIHLFAGFTVCVCGSKMYVPSNTPKYICYKCRNKIPIGDLEAVYLDELKDFFLSPEDIAAYLKSADDTVKEKEELLAAMQRDREKLREEMDSVYQLYVGKQITAEGFGKRYLPLEEKERQLEEEIPRIQGELDFLRVSFLSSDQIAADGKELYERWPELDPKEKRQVVESITDSIVVGKDDIEVSLFYFPQREKLTKEQQIVRDSSRRRADTAPERRPTASRAPHAPVRIRAAGAVFQARHGGIPAVRRETTRRDGPATSRRVSARSRLRPARSRSWCGAARGTGDAAAAARRSAARRRCGSSWFRALPRG